MAHQIGVRVEDDVYDALVRETEDHRKKTGGRITVSDLVRAAIEERLAKKKGRS
jgi:hypothetical protein